jgi:hypothetical protein
MFGIDPSLKDISDSESGEDVNQIDTQQIEEDGQDFNLASTYKPSGNLV